MDEFSKRIKQLRQNAKEISGDNEVSFAELFPDSFMEKYTDFSTMQEMVDAGGINEPNDIGKPEWSDFVAAHSQFTSWDEMFNTAGTKWIERKLVK